MNTTSEPRTTHYYVRINNSLVHLIQYGNGEKIIRSKSDNLHESVEPDGKHMVIFVPGNPGLLGAYHDYLKLLYTSLCYKTNEQDNPILLAISHNNFEQPKEGEEIITIEQERLGLIDQSISKTHEVHDVELQILNKLIILKSLLRLNLENCKLVFVGHSIGCYVILRLLQDGLVASAHHGSVMIHPALENLALTDKGSKIARCFDFRLDYLLRTLAFLSYKFLAESTRVDLAKRFTCSAEFIKFSSETVLKSLAKLYTPGPLGAMISMAKSEFAQVKNIDHESLIKPHVERLRLVYATQDHWVNSEHRKELLEVYPKLHVEERPRMHAFIMDPKTVEEYAHMTATHIKDFF